MQLQQRPGGNFRAASAFEGFPFGVSSDSRSKTEAILSRRALTDRQWALIAPLVPGKVGDRGRSGADNRLFVDAILWLARGATPWRDLPPELGNWRTVHSRFRRWTLSGVWESLFKALSAEPDFEYVLVDVSRPAPLMEWMAPAPGIAMCHIGCCHTDP